VVCPRIAPCESEDYWKSRGFAASTRLIWLGKLGTMFGSDVKCALNSECLLWILQSIEQALKFA
jgi:hypothetical protein